MNIYYFTKRFSSDCLIEIFANDRRSAIDKLVETIFNDVVFCHLRSYEIVDIDEKEFYLKIEFEIVPDVGPIADFEFLFVVTEFNLDEE